MLYEKNLEFEKNEKYLDTISLAFTDSLVRRLSFIAATLTQRRSPNTA